MYRRARTSQFGGPAPASSSTPSIWDATAILLIAAVILVSLLFIPAWDSLSTPRTTTSQTTALVAAPTTLQPQLEYVIPSLTLFTNGTYTAVISARTYGLNDIDSLGICDPNAETDGGPFGGLVASNTTMTFSDNLNRTLTAGQTCLGNIFVQTPFVFLYSSDEAEFTISAVAAEHPADNFTLGASSAVVDPDNNGSLTLSLVNNGTDPITFVFTNHAGLGNFDYSGNAVTPVSPLPPGGTASLTVPVVSFTQMNYALQYNVFLTVNYADGSVGFMDVVFQT